MHAVHHALPARVLFGTAAAAGRPRLDALLGGCDVVWAPAPAPLAPGMAPFVLTVHDRSWEERPQDFTHYERLWHAAARPRRLARRAARVLCDTEAVRGELIREWGLDPGRVRTAPLAPRRLAPGSARSAHPTSSRSARSSRARRRTCWWRASASPASAGSTAELIVAGDGRVNVEAPGVRRLGNVEDLGSLYAGALAVVLPSWVEGFGLTPVEGIAAGTPAIVSDLPVLREVLGDGALYVRPGDAEGLAERAAPRRGRPGAARAAAGGRAPRDRAAQLGRDRAADAGGAGGGRGRVSFAVVVVLHDSAGPLRALLDSLPLLPEPPQLIVVDTGSRDDGAALARAAGAEVVELGANPGFGAANNAGVERARHEVTVLLNPDCELLDGSLARLAARRGERPRPPLGPAPARGRRRGPALRAPPPRHRRRAAARARAPAGAAAGAARARRAVPRRAGAHGRVGDRRVRRGPDRDAAPPRARSTRGSSSSSRTWTCACAPAPPRSRRCSTRACACGTSAATPPAAPTPASRTSCSPAGAARSCSPTAAAPRSRSTTPRRR